MQLAPVAGASGRTPSLLRTRAQSEYLDVLRGMAAQLVLMQHALAYCLPGRGYDRHGLGALGVMTFFLLSGFLITHSIAARLRRGQYSLTEFVVSRFSRIYTPYVPAIMLVGLLDWFSSLSPSYQYRADYNVKTAVANLFMLQDFPVFQVLRRVHVPDQVWFVREFGSGRQFWTVSIEWWIYMAVGLATAIAVSRRRPSWVVLAILALVLIEPVYNLVGGPGDCLTFFWLAGGAACLIGQRVAARLDGRGRGLAALSWLTLATLAGARLLFTRGQIYEPVFAMLFAGLLFVPVLAYRAVSGPSIGHRLGIDRLSFHSYSLYLTHLSVIILLAAVAPALIAGWRGLALVVLIANAVAVPFAIAFESPHHRVRRAILGALGRGRE